MEVIDHVLTAFAVTICVFFIAVSFAMLIGLVMCKVFKLHIWKQMPYYKEGPMVLLREWKKCLNCEEEQWKDGTPKK